MVALGKYSIPLIEDIDCPSIAVSSLDDQQHAYVQGNNRHRKSREANVLRLIGVSWSSLRRAWLLILLPMCCLTTFIGALLTESFSSPMDAFLVLQDEPCLRLLPVLAVLLVTLIAPIIPYVIHCIWLPSIWRALTVVVLSSIIICALSYTIVLDKNERQFVVGMVKKFLKKK